MFILPLELSTQTKSLIEKIEKQIGTIPPHFLLLATLNPIKFKLFIKELFFILHHPHIDPDLFAFLRLFVATKEGFSYCQNFNMKMLLAKGYAQDQVEKCAKEINSLPFDTKHKRLATKAVKAIYAPESFNQKDIEELKRLNWSLEDIYDAIDHTAFMLKNGRMLQAFLT